VAQLSNRYAAALFELSLERGSLNENLDQAVFLRDTLQEKDTRQIITHPRISGAEKLAFLNGAFSGQLSQDLMGFLHLAIAKNREDFIAPILSEFIEMGNNHIRKTTALVISAVPLKAEQISALAALLARKLNKQVDIQQKVDPSVIGGLYIRADGYFIDRTIKNRLHEMKLAMAEGAV
jgi:F-type H+-transporting ATPase subunit delta